MPDSDEESGTVEVARVQPIITAHQQLPPIQTNSPLPLTPASGWWDVVSAVQTRPAPWHQRSASSDLPLPPGAQAAEVIDYADMSKLEISDTPPTPITAGSPKTAAPPKGPTSPSTPTKSRLFRSPTFMRSRDDKGKKSVTNEPGRWNRDMVANIMGSPVERR